MEEVEYIGSLQEQLEVEAAEEKRMLDEYFGKDINFF